MSNSTIANSTLTGNSTVTNSTLAAASKPDHYVLHGYQLVTLDWCCWAAVTMFVALRLYVRIHLRTGFSWNIKNWWRWADFFVVLSWLLMLFTCISDSLKNGWHVYGRGYESRELRITIQHFLIADTTVYFACMYSIKAAMLAFYIEIVPYNEYCKWLWRSLRIAVGFLALCFVYSMLAQLFTCFPLDRYYNDPNFRFCNKQLFYYWISSSTMFPLHIITDIMVYTLPFWIIKLISGEWTRGQTAGVLTLFFLGFLATACTGLNWGLSFAMNQSKIIQAIRYICNPVEETTGLIVACSPAFRFIIIKYSKHQGIRWAKGLPRRVSSVFSRKGSASTYRTDGAEVEKAHMDVAVQAIMVDAGSQSEGSPKSPTNSSQQKSSVAVSSSGFD